MVITSWKEKRNEIYNLAKKISDYYGGDDIDWLREYCADIILSNKNNLDIPLNCFREIANGLPACTRLDGWIKTNQL